MQIYFEIFSLIGAVLLINGLRNLSHPKTAVKGNIQAAFGIAIGIIVALFYPLETTNNNYLFIALGIIIGSMIGYISAKKVKMTAMPEMVSLFNGLGGLSAAFISLVWIFNNHGLGDFKNLSIVLLNLFLGFVAFLGSMVAYGKLSGKLKDKYTKIPFATYINLTFLLIIIVAIIYYASQGQLTLNQLILFSVISLIYGYTFVAPIGGADMPVVISLLNSLTGITAAISGIMTDNKLMLLGGILVGSSGIILTLLMCNAMNRSLWSVIFGSFSSSNNGKEQAIEGNVKTITPSDLAIQLAYSEKVAFIPGYGMAVAQAQKVVKEIEDLLEEKGVEVKYCIHPVAGRMPGHMNVLLAEADVSYDKLLDLDESNEYLKQTDVAIVIGANDVVNPAAKDDPNSKIYGMPILDVTKSKQVVVLKRSMNPGYAGIQNPLFFKENTKMLFGDAKKTLLEILAELKEADL